MMAIKNNNKEISIIIQWFYGASQVLGSVPIIYVVIVYILHTYTYMARVVHSYNVQPINFLPEVDTLAYEYYNMYNINNIIIYKLQLYNYTDT